MTTPCLGARWAAVCSLMFAALGTARADDPPADSFFPMPVTVPREAPAGDGPTEVRERLRVTVQRPGNSSRTQLQAAVSQLPLAQLAPADRQQIAPLIDSPSLYRRLPTLQCGVDSRAYRFFTDHPDVAVSIWRVMGISEMLMWQVGPNEYETDLRDGTFGVVKVLHRSPERMLVLCQGQFKSPLLKKPIRSVALLHLQTAFGQDLSGQPIASHTGDVFVHFDSVAVEAVAKLVSPMSFQMADRNFEEVTLFLRMMDEAMSREPGWIEQTAANLQGVLPGRDQELLRVTAAVYVDAQRRQHGGALVMPPVQSADSGTSPQVR